MTHGDCVDVAVNTEQTWPNYTMNCSYSGSVGCYADDTTYTCSGSDAAALSDTLTSKFKIISDFLVSNKLKLNDDKTHLMVMSTSQARLSRARKNTSYLVEIRTPAKIIESSSSEKLFGCTIHQDMKWAEHIQNSEDSLLRALNTRLNALKQLSKIAGFKTRKMVADGIFMSKLIYLIVLWGGCTKELSHALRGVYSSRRPNIFPHSVPISFPTRNPTFMGVYQKIFS